MGDVVGDTAQMLHFPYEWLDSDAGAVLRWNCRMIAIIRHDREGYEVQAHYWRARTRGRARSVRFAKYCVERWLLAQICRTSQPEHAAEMRRALREEWRVRKV